MPNPGRDILSESYLNQALNKGIHIELYYYENNIHEKYAMIKKKMSDIESNICMFCHSQNVIIEDL